MFSIRTAEANCNTNDYDCCSSSINTIPERILFHDDKTIVPEEPNIGKCSSLSAFTSIICLTVGVGALQLAYTLRLSGWFGISFIILSGIISHITAAITAKCLYLKPQGGRIAGFHELGYAAFGNIGYYTIALFNMANIIGSIGVFVILSANNMSDMFAQVGIHINPRLLMVVATVIMCVPTLIARTLGETLVVSIIGAATSYIMTLAIVVTSLIYPFGNNKGHVQYPNNNTEFVGPFKHFALIPGGFAVSLSSALFSYIGTTIVPHIEGSMRRPEKFTTVFGSSMFVITLIYVLLAITGYWAYGNYTLSPITLNLPQLWSTTLATISITIHVLFAGPLYLVQMALEIEQGLNVSERTNGSKSSERMWRLSIRLGLALVVVGIAESLPFFDDVIALISALTNPVLIYLAPIACYIKLKGWGNCPTFSLMWMGGLLVFGVAVSAVGLVETIKDIILSFKHIK